MTARRALAGVALAAVLVVAGCTDDHGRVEDLQDAQTEVYADLWQQAQQDRADEALDRWAQQQAEDMAIEDRDVAEEQAEDEAQERAWEQGGAP